MGILYNVKFQIYHEDAWDQLSAGVHSDETPTNQLLLLSRLQEILEIVDVRRKKHLQIQTQLTRHVAVLKYHRHYQDKEFPVRVSFLCNDCYMTSLSLLLPFPVAIAIGEIDGHAPRSQHVATVSVRIVVRRGICPSSCLHCCRRRSRISKWQ